MAISRRAFLKGSAITASAITCPLSADTNFYDIKQIPHATHFGDRKSTRLNSSHAQ